MNKAELPFIGQFHGSSSQQKCNLTGFLEPAKFNLTLLWVTGNLFGSQATHCRCWLERWIRQQSGTTLRVAGSP